MFALPASIYWLFYGATLLMIPVVIARKSRPVTAVAWIMAIVFLPFLGPLLFLTFGTDRIVNQGRKKLLSDSRLSDRINKFQDRWSPWRLQEAGHGFPAHLESIVRVSHHASQFDAATSNDVEILVDGRKGYAEMKQAIAEATHHVHMEYYIFRPDKVGRQFANLLMERSRAGVQVRLLYDAVGSFRLGASPAFLKRLREAGVEVEAFLPLRTFFRPWNLNLRNHRKLLVVDNKVAFTGSLNIGASFLNTRRRTWRETSMKLSGPVVSQLQWLFIEDWVFATDRVPELEPLFPPAEPAGNEVVQAIASGPDVRGEAILKAFVMAVSEASKSVFMTTPYFVPDPSLLLALELAANRQIDVRVLVPRQSDHLIVSLAGRSYYERLLENGVRIYEYEAGILHTKLLVVDSSFVALGSANADVRSFSYNFELNAQIYSASTAERAEALFFEDLENSREVDLEAFRNRSAIAHFNENLCRLLSPVL